MDSPPHLLMHFGMTGIYPLENSEGYQMTFLGWLYIQGESTIDYRGKSLHGEIEWPPKSWKFILKINDNKIEVAFADARRFGRVRLLDCAAEDIRTTTPLRENGLDPIIDKDKFTENYLEQKMQKRHSPLKSLLLDQANISGIGNYIGFVR